MNGLHFLRPEWLWLLPLCLVWLVAHWMQGRADGGWGKSVDRHLLAVMLGSHRERRRTGAVWLSLLGVIAVVALAGPSWMRTEVPVDREGQVRVFLLDMSRSMAATDMRPSRIAQARLKLLDLLALSNDRAVALVGFAAFPYTITPLTDDTNTLREIAPLIEPNMAPAQGGDIDAALKRAASLVEQAFAQRGEVIVLTDSTPSESALNQAALMLESGLTTSVLAFGEDKPVTVPFGQGILRDASGEAVRAPAAHSALKSLAEAGGGRFVRVDSGAVSVESVFLRDGSSLPDERDAEASTHIWRDDGAWLLWCALIPIAWLSRRGVLV